MNAPILPIVINGSRNALPKKSLTIEGKHTITLTVLDEISKFAITDARSLEEGGTKLRYSGG